MEAFNDVQFLREPRLRLLQQAFHQLQRVKQRWAEIGVFGAIGKKMVNPRMRLPEALAAATLQRATLHDYQADQVQLALRLAREFQQLIDVHGMKVGHRDMSQKPQWCDLGGTRLGTRLHVEESGAWLFQRYEPVCDADRPLGHIVMLVPRRGGQRVPATCKVLPCTGEAAMLRATEIAELGRWALRQGAYCPADAA